MMIQPTKYLLSPLHQVSICFILLVSTNNSNHYPKQFVSNESSIGLYKHKAANGDMT
jgi:hypothetical protein